MKIVEILKKHGLGEYELKSTPKQPYDRLKLTKEGGFCFSQKNLYKYINTNQYSNADFILVSPLQRLEDFLKVSGYENSAKE